jgi:enamine deaminase RidA (YjgF/YER057c/UK114 family)
MPALLRLHPGPRYSEASIHAGTIYLAGQVPTDTAQDIEGQTREVLDMVERLLLEAGSDKSRILMAQLYLANMADYAGMNKAWDQWVVPGSAPPRATVQAQLADPAWLIEVVVTAALP